MHGFIIESLWLMERLREGKYQCEANILIIWRSQVYSNYRYRREKNAQCNFNDLT